MNCSTPGAKIHPVLKHTWATWREFRQAKRWEAKVVQRALATLRMGCAHLPPDTYKTVSRMLELSAKLGKQVSVRELGR